VDAVSAARVVTGAFLARVVVRLLAGRPGQDRAPPAAPREESIAVVLELAREAQLAQLGELTRLDATASALLGFAGIVLGLFFTGNPATSHWSWPLSLSVALLSGSVMALGYALISRDYALSPNIAALDELAATANRRRRAGRIDALRAPRLDGRGRSGEARSIAAASRSAAARSCLASGAARLATRARIARAYTPFR
jgi:hypothetical protein